MDPDELVLSDVHTETVYEERESIAEAEVLSRFVYQEVPSNVCIISSEVRSEVEVDEDGDLVVQRKNSKLNTSVITIEHSLATTLNDVGLQVWKGALLLCDYIVDNQELFDGCFALELGAGVGFVSVTMATIARHVICTDYGEKILRNCVLNAERNKHLYKYNTGEDGDQMIISIKELNWLDVDLCTDEKNYFHWSKMDIDTLQKMTVLLAADVIYDDILTDNFFKTVYKMMSCLPPKILYISVEKRLNFTLADVDVACPAYNYFKACIDELSSRKSDNFHFKILQLETNFPQHFQYYKSTYLELWRIEAVLTSGK